MHAMDGGKHPEGQVEGRDHGACADPAVQAHTARRDDVSDYGALRSSAYRTVWLVVLCPTTCTILAKRSISSAIKSGVKT